MSFVCICSLKKYEAKEKYVHQYQVYRNSRMKKELHNPLTSKFQMERMNKFGSNQWLKMQLRHISKNFQQQWIPELMSKKLPDKTKEHMFQLLQLMPERKLKELLQMQILQE